MHIAIDLVLVAVMAATVINAAKKGFVLSLFNMFTVWGALAVAWIFCKDLGVYIDNMFISSNVEEYIVGLIQKLTEQNGGILNGEAVLESLPDGFADAAGVFGIDIEQSIGEFSGIIDGYAEQLSENISMAVSCIIAFAVIFILAIIVLKLLCRILDKFSDLPVLKQMNTFLGILFGIAEALILGIILAEIISALFGAFCVIGIDAPFTDAVEKTYIEKYLISVLPF